MRKIINGKKYDTETAEYIGEWWNGFPVTKSNYLKETLYRKKTGAFFLYVKYGPLTLYSEDFGRNGEEIVPLTKNEAESWSDCHLDYDDYEEIFDKVDE